MAKVYSFKSDEGDYSIEQKLMEKAVTRLLRLGNGIQTERYEINDGKDLYQGYAIYKIPGHLSFMCEVDFIPESDSHLVKYTVLEESPNSEAAKIFHQYANLLEGGLEKLFGIE